MADIRKLSQLFKAIADRDWTSAEAIARQIAVSEEEKGHHLAAQRLRGALNPNGNTKGLDLESEVHESFGSIASPQFVSQALRPIVSNKSLEDLRLADAASAILNELADEWLHRQALRRHGLPRRTKVLFHGPPGCGKSATARALARKLDLPAFVVRFDTVVGAYLGQTALHLRQVFRFAENTPSVLLIDEIDALGRRRGNPLDVGELDRVVIALLQELEHSEPQGLLVATSNLERSLDDALWRRFDLVLEFPRPNHSELIGFLRELAAARQLSSDLFSRKMLSGARSYADVEQIVAAAERRRFLAKL